MKLKYFLIFLLAVLIPALVIAGTISGIAKLNGSVHEGYAVSCYLYNGAVSNVAVGAAVDTDTSAADGTWSLTTANTNTHILKVIDPTNAKAGAVRIVTPD